MDSMSTNETVELTDLEPQDDVKGGPNTYTGTTTISAGTLLTSTQARQAAAARWQQVITGDVPNATF